MPICTLANIRAIFHFPEAYSVDKSGEHTRMVERPAAYGVPWNNIAAYFTEYYCTVHDCTFKTWRSAYKHLQQEDKDHE